MAKNYGNIKTFTFNGSGKIKGAASVELAGLINVNCRICEGSKGLFIGWPSRKGKDKETGGEKWFDEVFFKDKEFKAEVESAVLQAFSGKNGNPGKKQESTVEDTEEPPF